MMNFRKGLAEMPSYGVVERDWRIKVNANESTMNLPPLVEERIMARLSHVAFNRYPNEEYDDLTQQIADNFGMKKSQVLLGNGSSEIIEKIFYAFGGSRYAKIVYPEPSFSMYHIYAKAAGAMGVSVPLGKDYRFDTKKFIKTVREEKPRLAVLCNPNNPTGGAIAVDEIEEIAKSIDCPFLVDEAYVEFYGRSARGLLKQYPHVMVARTFSKAYALASARVGYLLADEKMIEMLGKTYMPYHMNVLSLVTADIVYQMRQEFVPRIQMLVAERKRMSEALAKLDGMKVYPSETNFLLVKYSRAKKLNAFLEEQGVGIRSFGDAAGLKNCLRISMGMREENDQWYRLVKDFVEGRA